MVCDECDSATKFRNLTVYGELNAIFSVWRTQIGVLVLVIDGSKRMRILLHCRTVEFYSMSVCEYFFFLLLKCQRQISYYITLRTHTHTHERMLQLGMYMCGL